MKTLKKRTGRMCVNIIKMELKGTGHETVVCNQLAKDRFHRRVYIKTIMNLLAP
jgi:hypothetical protein